MIQNCIKEQRLLNQKLTCKWAETVGLYSDIRFLFKGYGRKVIFGPVTYLGDLSIMALQSHQTLICGCTEHSRCTWQKQGQAGLLVFATSMHATCQNVDFVKFRPQDTSKIKTSGGLCM